jgi:hypothetical protein
VVEIAVIGFFSWLSTPLDEPLACADAALTRHGVVVFSRAVRVKLLRLLVTSIRNCMGQSG